MNDSVVVEEHQSPSSQSCAYTPIQELHLVSAARERLRDLPQIVKRGTLL